MYGIRLNEPIIKYDDDGKKVEVIDYIKCKGFPKKLFNYNMYKRAFKSSDYSEFKYKAEKIATPFESMRRNKSFVSMIEKTRSVIQKYDKRKVRPDGVTTTPYKVFDVERAKYV